MHEAYQVIYGGHICVRARIAQSVQRLGYGLDDRGVGVRFPVRARNFSFLHNVKTTFGALLYNWYRVLFSRGKAAGP
jgi:hypothetical protein